jgi:hypothetical protein
MPYLVEFLISLAVLAATPALAQDNPNKGCVTVEKFVEQNADTAPVTWVQTLAPHQINPVRDALGVPENANVTEIRLFSAHLVEMNRDEAGIAFGHDGLICVFAHLPPSGVLLVKHILEALKGTEL